MNLRPGAPALACIALFTAACGGPLTPSPIQGEPVCPDFEIGATHALMRGSLRFPVTVQLHAGKKTLTRTTLSGRRTPDDPPSRMLVADDNAEYEVAWAQCPNERAPRALTLTQTEKDAAAYACGDAVVYKTEKLVTKKGDPASRTLTFPPPPNAACWQSEVPKVEAPPEVKAPEPSAAPPEGGVDAGAATDAGSAPIDAGADAGKAPKDAGTGADAGKARPAK